MILSTPKLPYLLRPLSTYLLVGLILVNTVAVFKIDPFYIGSFISFLYILITPGFLLLPLLTKKQFPAVLGITFSIALTVLMLMVIGFGLNTFLPLLGMHQPLSMAPLLIAFDLLLYGLLVLNYEYKENSPFEIHNFNTFNWLISGISLLLPISACLGAIVLNNGGPDVITMAGLALAAILTGIVVIYRNKLNSTTIPLVLYMMALTFLLMNSMRGWYITGHDILLEYHIFVATNSVHFWDIASYRDPYTACLSITILPTYLQSLMHVSNLYIFKFYIQFIGALAVLPIYYISKRYTSETIAFLSGFLYVSFPTFMVDMAFLNRQGIGFLFFGILIYVLLADDHFSGRRREVVLFLLGLGMVLSHYSTSYVAMALFAGAYIINKILHLVMTAKKPKLLAKLTRILPNKEIYKEKTLISFIFVFGLLVCIFLWSVVITKTSSNLTSTIGQIITSVEHPFSLDDYSGAAKYSLTQSKSETPQDLFNDFIQEGIQAQRSDETQSNFFSLSITEEYPLILIQEPLVPLTHIGSEIQSLTHLNLSDVFNQIKLTYAKILQVLLLIGFIGLGLGYSFRKNITASVPAEYLSLSIAGIIIMVAQTILPADAINYGLLRLFQQNLIFLALPIVIGLIFLFGIFIRNHKTQLILSTVVLLFFFASLSGFLSQFTGGARAPLPLDNYGFYYDAYYTHAQEIYAIQWLDNNIDYTVPVQSDHYFSSIKLIAYGNIVPVAGLLPQTIRKNSFVYLNYNNSQQGNIVEFINGDAFYYRFPLNFLDAEKDLVYDDGGSRIYR